MSTETLRSMLIRPEAADDVRDAIPADDPVLRATLIGTAILGDVNGRHLLQLDALRDPSPEQVTDLLRPCFPFLANDPARNP